VVILGAILAGELKERKVFRILTGTANYVEVYLKPSCHIHAHTSVIELVFSLLVIWKINKLIPFIVVNQRISDMYLIILVIYLSSLLWY
jgi:hypothetical protein